MNRTAAFKRGLEAILKIDVRVFKVFFLLTRRRSQDILREDLVNTSKHLLPKLHINPEYRRSPGDLIEYTGQNKSQGCNENTNA